LNARTESQLGPAKLAHICISQKVILQKEYRNSPPMSASGQELASVYRKDPS